MGFGSRQQSHPDYAPGRGVCGEQGDTGHGHQEAAFTHNGEGDAGTGEDRRCHTGHSKEVDLEDAQAIETTTTTTIAQTVQTSQVPAKKATLELLAKEIAEMKSMLQCLVASLGDLLQVSLTGVEVV